MSWQGFVVGFASALTLVFLVGVGLGVRTFLKGA